MQNELPIRWVLRESQGEKGLEPKKRLTLQMKVFLVSDRPVLVGSDVPPPEQQWVDVPTVIQDMVEGKT